MDNAPRHRAAGGRDAKRAARSIARGGGTTFIRRKIPVFEVLGEEGLALIEQNADTILAEIGIDFRDTPEALELWKSAGACASRAACAAS
jgi:trimethylamine--corrinoid protein Co-methyltransferase